jgi:ABC-2 type transport system permease protein
VIWRNTIIFLHNLPVVALALFVGDYKITWNILLLIPLTMLVPVALIFPIALFARLTLWRRELRSLIPSVIQVGFFLTPILWSPPTAGPMKVVFNLNPVGWFIVLVKDAVLINQIHWSLLLRCLIVVFGSLILIELLQSQLRNVRKLI